MTTTRRNFRQMTREELGAVIADLDKGLAVALECMAMFRLGGVSHSTLARLFGYSKSAFHRDFARPIDAIVSQMGQDEAENDKLLSEWSSRMVPVLFAPPARRRPARERGRAAHGVSERA